MLGAPDLERGLLELTYNGVMTVTGTRKEVVNGETVVTPDAALYENLPCALSFSDTPSSESGEDSGQVRYQATIFCEPEPDLPTGCRITVQQCGVTYRLKYSGERIVYPTHQQLSAVREVRP